MNLKQLRAIPVDRAHALALEAVAGSLSSAEPMAKKIAIGVLGFAVPMMIGMWAVSNGVIGGPDAPTSFVVKYDVEGRAVVRSNNPLALTPTGSFPVTFSAGQKVTAWPGESYSGKADCYVRVADMGWTRDNEHAVMVGVLPCSAMRAAQ